MKLNKKRYRELIKDSQQLNYNTYKLITLFKKN